jgi:integrase
MVAREVAALAGNLQPSQLTEAMMLGLAARWRAKYARTTAYKRTKLLRRMLRELEGAGAPKMNIPRAPAPRPCTNIAAPEELQALIAAADPWMRLFLLLTSALGLRFAEAARIDSKCWNQEQHTITYVKKGGDKHTLPVTPEIEALFQLAPEGPEPFLWRLAGKQLSKRPDVQLRFAFAKLRRKAGVRTSLTPHALRRTAAITMYALTKDIRAVQQLLGHANMSTTAWYLAHQDTEKLRPLVEQMWQSKGPVQ